MPPLRGVRKNRSPLTPNVWFLDPLHMIIHASEHYRLRHTIVHLEHGTPAWSQYLERFGTMVHHLLLWSIISPLHSTMPELFRDTLLLYGDLWIIH